MRTKVYIQNLKCGGCAKTIESALSALEGVHTININHDEDSVEFTKDQPNIELTVLSKLRQLGYPPIREKNGLTLKAKSVISCMKGRLDK